MQVEEGKGLYLQLLGGICSWKFLMMRAQRVNFRILIDATNYLRNFNSSYASTMTMHYIRYLWRGQLIWSCSARLHPPGLQAWYR